MTQNANLRLLDNNLNDSATATITYSSQLSATYAASNARDQLRSRVWKPSGQFEVKSTNCTIYINDGGNVTVTLSAASYATGTLFAAAIQTALNAASSSWTCTYSTSTYRFTIARSSGTAVLRFTQTSNAAWDILGFTATADDSTGPFQADEPRIHTSEWYQIDLGAAYPLSAFAAIGPIDENFAISAFATVRIMGSNVDGVWSSPGLTVSITQDAAGAVVFLDGQTDYTYRFWRFEWIDRTNPAGPSSFKISHLYFGDFVTLTTSNAAPGFGKDLIDQSEVAQSENGTLYFRTRPKLRAFSSVSLQLVAASERRTLEEAFQRIGIDQCCYLAIDPTLTLSATAAELMLYGRFTSVPKVTHVVRDYYTVDLEFREAI